MNPLQVLHIVHYGFHDMIEARFEESFLKKFSRNGKHLIISFMNRDLNVSILSIFFFVGKHETSVIFTY
jgi:hypothetical protein